MNKTDGQLRSEIEASEVRAEWGAWAVVVGLVLEIILATAHSLGYEHKNIENWGTVLADSLIALGVYCEIHFGRKASRSGVELRRRSDEAIAAANVRAAEAELRTEQLKSSLAWRRLSRQQIEKINEILSRADLPKFGLAISHPAGDPEAITFASDIADVFRHNGWPVLFLATTSGIPPGMMIPLYGPPDTDACGIVRAAIASAGIEFVGGASKASGGLSSSSGDDLSGPTAEIYVGSRLPPELA